MEQNYTRLKYSCYTVNVIMAIVSNLSPILFTTFRNLYGISYSLLGFLVLVNFITQLAVDLIFSFFSHKFVIEKTVKATPLIALIGLTVYSVWPFVFPNSVYLGLFAGTLIFSAAGGLGEVLISPVIASIPSENPDKEMSKLHSVYAWGVVFVIIISSCFILLFGADNWQYLAMVFAAIPLVSIILFSKTKIPQLDTGERISNAIELLKNKKMWFCIIAIFFGGMAECTMAQWCSGFLEKALSIKKIWGDIFGVALFSIMLGLGRTLYSKIGRNVSKVLLMGIIGASACYFIAAFSKSAFAGLFACVITGFCVSMLWPGSLIVVSDIFPNAGVLIYAMMAAGGDLGASVGPQLVGIIADCAVNSQMLSEYAISLGFTPEQFGMKLGIFVGGVLILLAVPFLIKIRKILSKKNYIQ